MFSKILGKKKFESHEEILEEQKKLIDEFKDEISKTKKDIHCIYDLDTIYSNDKDIILLEIMFTLKKLEEGEYYEKIKGDELKKIKALQEKIKKIQKNISNLLKQEKELNAKKTHQVNGSQSYESDRALHEEIKKSPKKALMLVQTQRGLALDQKDSDGNTLLHVAFQKLGEEKLDSSSFSDLLNLIKLLSTKKADFFVLNEDKKTPLDLFFKKTNLQSEYQRNGELYKRIVVVFSFIEKNKLVDSEALYNYVISVNRQECRVLLDHEFLEPKKNEFKRLMEQRPLDSHRIRELMKGGVNATDFLNAEYSDNILYKSISLGDLQLAIYLLETYEGKIKFTNYNRDILTLVLNGIEIYWFNSRMAVGGKSEEDLMKDDKMELFYKLIEKLFFAGANGQNQDGRLLTSFLGYKGDSFSTEEKQKYPRPIRKRILQAAFFQKKLKPESAELLCREVRSNTGRIETQKLTIWHAALESRDLCLLDDLLGFVDIDSTLALYGKKSFFEIIASELLSSLVRKEGFFEKVKVSGDSKKTASCLNLLKNAIPKCNKLELLNNENLIKCALIRAVREKNNNFILELINKKVNISDFNLFSFYLEEKKKTVENDKLSKLKFEENDFILLKAFRDAGAEMSGAPFIKKQSFLAWAKENHKEKLEQFLAAQRNEQKSITDFVIDKILSKAKAKSESESELWSSLSDDDKSKLEEFIRAGFNVNTKLSIGKTLLHVAIEQGNCELVRFLVKQGASDDIALDNMNNSMLTTVRALLEKRRNAASELQNGSEKEKEIRVVSQLISALDEAKKDVADLAEAALKPVKKLACQEVVPKVEDLSFSPHRMFKEIIEREVGDASSKRGLDSERSPFGLNVTFSGNEGL